MTEHSESAEQAGEEIPVDRLYGPVSGLFAALAAPLRAAIIHRLIEREHNVSELAAALGAAQPLISQHLSKLRYAGLIQSERRGRQVIYRIADEHVAHVFLDAFQHSIEQGPD